MNEKKDTDCQICNEAFDSGSEPETPVTLTCGHTFGSVCISRWMHVPGRRHTCPTCRQKLFTAQRILPEERGLSEEVRQERLSAQQAIRNLTEEAEQYEQRYARALAENRVLRLNQAYELRNSHARLSPALAQDEANAQHEAEEAVQNRITSPTTTVHTRGGVRTIAPGERFEIEQGGIWITFTTSAQNIIIQVEDRGQSPPIVHGTRTMTNFPQPQFPESTSQRGRLMQERCRAVAPSMRPTRDALGTEDPVDVSDVNGHSDVRSNFGSNRQILRNHGNPVQPNFRSRVSNGAGTQASTNLAPPLAAANGEDLPLRPTRPSNLTRDPTARVERVAMPSRRLPIRSHPLTPEELGLRDDSDT